MSSTRNMNFLGVARSRPISNWSGPPGECQPSQPPLPYLTHERNTFFPKIFLACLTIQKSSKLNPVLWLRMRRSHLEQALINASKLLDHRRFEELNGARDAIVHAIENIKYIRAYRAEHPDLNVEVCILTA